MRGIARLGTLKGISQTFTAFKQQEMKDKAEADRLKAKAEADKEAAKLAHERAIELKEVENEHDKLMKGRELYYENVRFEQEQMNKTAELELEQEQMRREEVQEERNRQHEIKVAKLESRLRQKEKTVAYEKAVAQTFGLVEEVDEGDGSIVNRLPTGDEMAKIYAERMLRGEPTVIPKEIGSIPGIEQYIKSYAVSKGIGGDYDVENPLFSYTRKNGKTKIIYGIGKDRKADRAIRGMSAIWTQVGIEDLAYIKSEYEKDNKQPFNSLLTHLNNYGKNAYLTALGGTKTEADGSRVIGDPLTATLYHSIEDAELRDWALKNLIAPTVDISYETLKKFAGIPQQYMTRDEVREAVIIPSREDYEWALDPDSSTAKIRDDLWASATKVSKYAGVSPESVIKTFSMFDDPILAMRNAEKDQKMVKGLLFERLDGKYDIRGPDAARLRQAFIDKGLESTEERIAFVRQNLEKTDAMKPSKIRIGADGNEKIVTPDTKDSYGITQEDAASQADAARQVVSLSKRLEALQRAGLGSPGFKGTTIRALGGLKQIGLSLLEMASTYNVDDDVKARMTKNAKKLEDFMTLDIDDQIEGQALYDLLAEQLAFAMAAAFQKGEGGRAISDRDVEAMRSVLGLRKLTANDKGALRNLQYLQEDFGRIAAIQDQYAKAGDSLMFKAAYIVDKTGRHMKSVDEIIAGANGRYNTFAFDPVTGLPLVQGADTTVQQYSNTDVGSYPIAPGVNVNSAIAR